MNRARSLPRWSAWSLLIFAAWCGFVASRPRITRTQTAVVSVVEREVPRPTAHVEPVSSGPAHPVLQQPRLPKYVATSSEYRPALPSPSFHINRQEFQEIALLKVLRGGQDVATRADAARQLSGSGSMIARAGLRAALKDETPVRLIAAVSLVDHFERGVEGDIYELFWEEMPPEQRAKFLSYLLGWQPPGCMRRLLTLLARLEEEQPELLHAHRIDLPNMVSSLLRRQFIRHDPMPRTAREWRDYWDLYRPWISDERYAVREHLQEIAGEILETDPGKLQFAATLDAATYRVREPIRMELSVTNESYRTAWTVPPRFGVSWYNKEFGVHLERIGETVEVLHHVPARQLVNFAGLYSGPGYTCRPEALYGRGTLRSVSNLREWLQWQTPPLWPLSEGNYELTLTYDVPPLPGTHGVEKDLSARAILRKWTTTVEFTIAGDELDDPAECLRVVERKCGCQSLRDDLSNTSGSFGQAIHLNYPGARRQTATMHLAMWGDERLTPLFPGADLSYVKCRWAGLDPLLVMPHNRTQVAQWLK